MQSIEKQWYHSDADFEQYILAGDIGGTHTNLALFGESGRALTMLFKAVYATQEITEFDAPLSDFLDEIRRRAPERTPQVGSISVAGPARNNYCKLTNATWAVDGDAVTEQHGIRTIVINDFLALSYAIPLLDLDDPAQIAPLRHSDGSSPRPEGNIMAVVGAGTGLGTGFLVRHGEEYLAYPTEGGHSDYSPVDDLTRELAGFVQQQYSFAPGAEPFVAGRGIANIYNFRKANGMAITGVLAEIDGSPDEEKPSLISKAAEHSKECREIMELYISIYARYAARAALMYLPTGGLFIAGGVAAKNIGFIREKDLFMRSFEQSYKENIHEVLMSIPVYVVLDYAISLYGAANAARILIR